MKRSGPIARKTTLKPGTKTLAKGKPMKQGRSTGKATVRQAKRWDAIRECGCIVCMQMFARYDPVSLGLKIEIHHLTVGGRHGAKRRGHDFTIGLCTWHHRGAVPPFATGIEGAGLILGPSYHHNAREFRLKFGNDDHLLERQNDRLKWPRI